MRGLLPIIPMAFLLSALWCMTGVPSVWRENETLKIESKLLTLKRKRAIMIRTGGGGMIDQNSCGALIKQIHDELEKNANNAMRSSDITMAQCSALLILNGAPEKQMALKALERMLRVAQSTAAGIVARLEQKGLVQGFGSPDDRRIKMVRITPRGVECCQRAEQDMERTEQSLLSGLTPTEQEIFLSLLKKVRDTL